MTDEKPGEMLMRYMRTMNRSILYRDECLRRAENLKERNVALAKIMAKNAERHAETIREYDIAIKAVKIKHGL